MTDLTRRCFMSLGAAAGLVAALPKPIFGDLPTSKMFKEKSIFENSSVLEKLKDWSLEVTLDFEQEAIDADGLITELVVKNDPIIRVEVKMMIPEALLHRAREMMVEGPRWWEFSAPRGALKVSGDFASVRLREIAGQMAEVDMVSASPINIEIDNQGIVL